MYKAYTGRQFFAGLDEQAVFGKVLDEPQENEPRFNRPTPKAFSELITKAIAKSRATRYRTVAEFLKDLETYQSQIVDSEAETISMPAPDSGGPPSQKVHELEAREEKARNLEEEFERLRQEALHTQQ